MTIHPNNHIFKLDFNISHGSKKKRKQSSIMLKYTELRAAKENSTAGDCTNASTFIP